MTFLGGLGLFGQQVVDGFHVSLSSALLLVVRPSRATLKPRRLLHLRGTEEIATV